MRTSDLATTLLALMTSLGCGPSSSERDVSTPPDVLGDRERACLLGFSDQGKSCDFTGSCQQPQHCCGISSEGTGCGCANGRVFCVIDDTCHFTQCSPGCLANQFTTSDGCTACGEIDGVVQRRLEAAARAKGSCEVDDDCLRVTQETRCGTYCNLAVAKSEQGTFAVTAAEIGDSECRDFTEHECKTHGLCTADGAARCVEGACRFVRTCDPARGSVGTPCDDGDPCTVGDTCTAAFVCSGQARDCDDQNPCTADTCKPDGTCGSTPATALCEVPEGSCAVGAECLDGVCTESEFLGFTRSFPKPWRHAEAIASRGDSDDSPIFVGGFQGQSESESFVLTLDSRGQVTRTLTLAQPESVTALAALPDGELLIAGEAWGTKTDIWVARLDADGTERWHAAFVHDHYDRSPRLAVRGEGVAALSLVAWTNDGLDGPPEAHVALLTSEGRALAEQTLGPGARARTSLEGDVFVTALPTSPDGAVFVTAHTRTDLHTDHAEVLLTRIAADGRLLGQTPIPTDRDEDARGLTGLPDGGVLVWGVHLIGSPSQPGTRDGAGWLRRVSASGEVLYELPLNIAAAFVRDDHLELVGADPIPGADFEIGTRAWLGRLDLDVLSTPSPTRWDMPPGPAIRAAAPLHTGVVLLGNLWDRDPLLNPLGDGSDAAAWVRRAALELPSCDPRP